MPVTLIFDAGGAVAAGFDDDSSAQASESRALVVAALERSMLNTAKQEVSKRGSQTGNGNLSDVILICSRLGAGALGSGSVALKVSRRSRQSVCRQEVSSLWYSSHPSYFVHRAHCFFFFHLFSCLSSEGRSDHLLSTEETAGQTYAFVEEEEKESTAHPKACVMRHSSAAPQSWEGSSLAVGEAAAAETPTSAFFKGQFAGRD